jgi:hypothetical protein
LGCFPTAAHPFQLLDLEVVAGGLGPRTAVRYWGKNRGEKKEMAKSHPVLRRIASGMIAHPPPAVLENCAL